MTKRPTSPVKVTGKIGLHPTTQNSLKQVAANDVPQPHQSLEYHVDELSAQIQYLTNIKNDMLSYIGKIERLVGLSQGEEESADEANIVCYTTRHAVHRLTDVREEYAAVSERLRILAN